MSSTMTLRRWGEQWLRIKEEEGLRSIQDMRCHWRCHVLEAGFIDRPLAEIRRSDVRDFMRSRLSRSGRHSRIVPGGRATTDTGRPLSRSMVTKTAHPLHGAFAYAVEEELIEANPSSGLRLIRGPRRCRSSSPRRRRSAGTTPSRRRLRPAVPWARARTRSARRSSHRARQGGGRLDFPEH